MAETDVSHEFRREHGFSSLVFVRFLTLNVLICYTWRFHWDVSWMLNHRKTQNCQNYFKISKLGFILLVCGIGPVSECGLVSCLFWLRKDINFISPSTPLSTIVKTDHIICVCQSESPEWESGESSLVCLCHGSVYCASVPACQKSASMPEGHPWSVCASLDISWRFQRS